MTLIIIIYVLYKIKPASGSDYYCTALMAKTSLINILVYQLLFTRLLEGGCSLSFSDSVASSMATILAPPFS